MTQSQKWWAVAGLLLLTLVPVLVADYGITLVTEILIAGVFVSGVNLLLGYTGLVPLGSAMFVGLGAYGYTVLAKFAGLPVPIAFFAAVVIVALLAILIGAICTRTREVEFLLITLAFCQMFYGAAVKSKPTGGTDGMTGVPRPDLAWLGLNADSATGFYVYVAVVSAFMLVALAVIVRSPFGSVLVGIRENEKRVEAMGYITVRYKIAAFVIAAAFAAVAGALTAQYSYFINPEAMTWQVGGEAVLMVIIGGRRHLLGGFVGAAVFILTKQALSAVTQDYLIFFGLFFMLVVVFLKDGALGLVENVRRHFNGERRAANS